MKRNPQLDLLRGLAVLMVICHHYFPPAARQGHFVSRVGWAGVDLFFVLSGFLISGLLFTDIQKLGTIRVGRFFVRRAFKIYPAFYAFLLLTLNIKLSIPDPELAHRIAAEGFFMQDYFAHLWPHTWSLGVEEKFYLLLPLLLIALVKFKRLHWIPAVSAALLILCLALRLSSTAPGGFDGLHLRADGLFLGVALGYLFHFHRGRFAALSKPWMLLAALAFLVPLSLYGIERHTLPLVLTTNSLGFACLLWWAMGQSIRLASVEKTGLYSYSIYLWHIPVTIFLRQFHNGYAMLAVNILICSFVGILMAKAVEFPALALRDRITSRPAVQKPLLVTAALPE